MKVNFRSSDPEGATWKQHGVERLNHTLRRLQGLVARVKVRLEDINGPQGGVDKRCRVEVSVRGAEPVAVTATSRSWQDALDSAAAHLRRRVLLQLRRAAALEHIEAPPASRRPPRAEARAVRQPLRLARCT